MKYLTLVWAGLWRKKARTILTVFSIVTAFFLFGMLQGLNQGIETLSRDLLDTTRLRVINRANQMGMMPMAHVTRIASLPGVASVTGLVALPGTFREPSNVVVPLGVDLAKWFELYPEFKIPREQLENTLRTRNGALIGVVSAEKQGLKIGDRLPVQAFQLNNSDGAKNWEFTITGIYDIDNAHDFATNILVSLDYLNEARVAGKDTVMQIIVRSSDPSRSAAIAAAIDETFANSPHQTLSQNERDFVQSTMNQIGDIGFFVNGIVSAVLFTLLFLTANTMAQSVRERIPEIAVLKTLGFSDATMLSLVLTESLLLSLFAAGIGLVAATLGFNALMSRVGSAMGLEGMSVPGIVFAWGAIIALLLAIASGLPPAWRARQLKIVDALRKA